MVRSVTPLSGIPCSMCAFSDDTVRLTMRVRLLRACGDGMIHDTFIDAVFEGGLFGDAFGDCPLHGTLAVSYTHLTLPTKA